LIISSLISFNLSMSWLSSVNSITPPNESPSASLSYSLTSISLSINLTLLSISLLSIFLVTTGISFLIPIDIPTDKIIKNKRMVSNQAIYLPPSLYYTLQVHTTCQLLFYYNIHNLYYLQV